MKLPLGLGFALLLMLPNLKQVSPQEAHTWNLDETTPSPYGEMMAENTSGLSGDWEHQFSNQSSEDTAVIPISSEEPVNDTDSATLTPSPHIPLNSSEEVSPHSNETSTQKYNTSSPVTGSPDPTPAMNNETGLNNTTTLQPETNSTQPSSGTFPSNVTVIDTFDTQNSTVSSTVNSTTAYPPQGANITTSQSPSTASANATVPTTTTELPTTESTTAQTTKPNRTGGSFDIRGNSERGVASDIKQKAKSQAWGAIIGVGVAVAIVALVVYVIMKRRSHRDFSHRKLVEDMPPEPVLRLDNSEPLDLKYEGNGYYNPGIQGDNIQMTNFPRGHSN
ncbi:uncharacterized protein [Salminus brasiliensis]|uniref:uncharacterized protein n=1 Tax=Salminus brasiliensis TaxID=930266 RepID=UPI003B82CCEB